MKQFILSREHVYAKSVHNAADGWVWMEKGSNQDVLMACGDAATHFIGEADTFDGIQILRAPLSHENAQTLRRLFPFTAPVPVLRKFRSFGVGDRLGIACPGHIRVFQENPDVSPIFVQQSIRELDLTGRRYEEVLDSATFAVFREDFRNGFGADGDHLKKEADISYALGLGFTMITLDCSEHIRSVFASASDADIDAACALSEELEAFYTNRTFEIENGISIQMDRFQLKRCQLIYGDAIRFAADIYHRYIVPNKDRVDFELSIDETDTPTQPAQHFFIASELKRLGVVPTSLAPRFCGEFQKGIDYIGDVTQFQAELETHAAIARYFGYKLSLHSGSDKFSVFSCFGALTRGNYHVKTAGTNWLEAMRIVAQKAPSLYRQIHRFALEHFEEARKYYHVTTQIDKIADLHTLSDEALPALFSDPNARQLIHITYGLILQAKSDDGTTLFRDKLYQLWYREADAYSDALYSHIGRHIQTLHEEI